MIFPNDRAKRMFEDGISIAMITEMEIDKLLKDNELRFKEEGINYLEQKALMHIAISEVTINIMRLGIYVRLIPELMRIVANGIDLMIQNRDKEEKR